MHHAILLFISFPQMEINEMDLFGHFLSKYFLIFFVTQFVREKVVEMSEEDYEKWFQVTFPQPKRAASAPPSRTSGFRY
jgi:hypothetical protein